MKYIKLKASENTPYVKVDPEEGVVVIRGNSFPENGMEFYRPIIDMVEELHLKSSRPISINLALGYFNTVSSKCFIDLFRMLKKSEDTGGKATINCSYEKDGDEMRETGEDYANLLDMQFNMVELNQIEVPEYRWHYSG